MSWVSKTYFVTLVAVLAAALCFGGSSSEGLKALSVVYLISSLILVFVFSFRRTDWVTKAHLFLFSLLGCLALWITFQFLPIGLDLTANNDRELAASGLAALSQPDAIRAISFFPERVLTMLVAFALPLVVFTLVSALPKRIDARALIWIIPVFGAASSILGLVQVLGGVQPELYLYENTNMGGTVGVFANVNHQACFLVMTLPFAIMASAQAGRAWSQSDSQLAISILFAAISLIIIVGVLTAGSIAGYALLAGVLICFALKFLGFRPTMLRFSIVVGGAISVIFLFAALVFSSPMLTGLGETSFDVANDSRIGMNLTGLEIWQQHWLWGTGPGTLSQVFPLYENTETVSSTFVNHLHNEYLQWAIEIGLPGILILLSLLAWIVRRSILLAFSNKRVSGVQFSAVVAIWAPILHSFVDYSMRNPTIVAFSAVCLAIIAIDFAVEFGKGR